MYVIRLCYDVRGWAYFQRCSALLKYKPADFEVSIGPNYGDALKRRPHDLIFTLVYPCAKATRRHCDRGNYNMVVMTGYNVSSTASRDWIKQALKHSHHVVINSEKCWHELGEPDHTTWISNGVDREVYAIKVPPAKRKPKVISIGSIFHHRNKGFDDILPQVKERLQAFNIPCDFRKVDSHDLKRNMNAEQITDWYNSATIYLVASEHEGTPNPALEAASAGCVVVATPVGNMPELIVEGVNGMIVKRDVGEIVDAVKKCQSRYVTMSTAMNETIEQWHWKYRSKQYFDLFRALIEKNRAKLLQVTTQQR